MKYGIQLVETHGHELPGHPWLEAFDPDFSESGEYPTGKIDATDDPTKAMVFEHVTDAWELWKRQALSVPLRPDGEPNRPLTAFTIAVEPLPVASPEEGMGK